MTAELTAMWATIATAWPHALQAIPRSSQPSDGQPTGTIDPRKSPVNDTAQSWCAEVEQAAFGWGEAMNVDANIRWLCEHIPNADGDALQEFAALSERLAKEATRFIPAHTQVTGITATQAKTAQVHCETIELLAKTLKAIGHTTPQGTLHYWVHEGRITKTSKGYPLWQALEWLETRHA